MSTTIGEARGSRRRGLYRRWGKRTLDLALTLASAVVTVPLALLVAVLVGIRLGRPVLFRQSRPGLEGRSFELLKFRTMTDDRDEQGQLLPDRQRLPPFGRFLRRSSLDELPSLWNVLRGEMSLVGPRPLLMHYLERYTPEQSRRHEMPPGLTGWAQIHGRNALSWKEKFELDVWYVDHASLGLDLRILFGTVVHVFRGTGISSPGHATMPEFRGQEDDSG